MRTPSIDRAPDMWTPVRTLNAVRNVATPRTFRRGAAQLTSLHAVTSAKTEPPPRFHSLEMANKRRQLLERPGLLTYKRGMISWFTNDGKQLAATVLEVDLCEVLQNKTLSLDGYYAVQLGQGTKLKNVTAQLLKHCQKAGVSPKKHIAEFRVRDASGLIPEGTEVTADYFASHTWCFQGAQIRRVHGGYSGPWQSVTRQEDGGPHGGQPAHRFEQRGVVH